MINLHTVESVDSNQTYIRSHNVVCAVIFCRDLLNTSENNVISLYFDF